jgi:hypothetical protein
MTFVEEAILGLNPKIGIGGELNQLSSPIPIQIWFDIKVATKFLANTI